MAETHTASGTPNERWQKPAPVKPLLTAAQLKQIDPLISDKSIEVFLPHINTYLPKYNIDTPQRIAAYLGQVLHESGHFKYVREIWGPTPQQKRYERDFNAPWRDNLKKTDRNWLAYQLGNSRLGDGKFLKGVGLLQVTGGTNLKTCSIALFGDTRLLQNPELLTVPEYAVQSSCWFFEWKQLLDELDSPGVEDETKKVNGGHNGLAERKAIYNKAIAVLTA